MNGNIVYTLQCTKKIKLVQLPKTSDNVVAMDSLSTVTKTMLNSIEPMNFY